MAAGLIRADAFETVVGLKDGENPLDWFTVSYFGNDALQVCVSEAEGRFYITAPNTERYISTPFDSVEEAVLWLQLTRGERAAWVSTRDRRPVPYHHCQQLKIG